jgi:hypothetical protein
LTHHWWLLHVAAHSHHWGIHLGWLHVLHLPCHHVHWGLSIVSHRISHHRRHLRWRLHKSTSHAWHHILHLRDSLS